MLDNSEIPTPRFQEVIRLFPELLPSLLWVVPSLLVASLSVLRLCLCLYVLVGSFLTLISFCMTMITRLRYEYFSSRKWPSSPVLSIILAACTAIDELQSLLDVNAWMLACPQSINQSFIPTGSILVSDWLRRKIVQYTRGENSVREAIIPLVICAPIYLNRTLTSPLILIREQSCHFWPRKALILSYLHQEFLFLW